MLAKNGLLIISNPKHIHRILSDVNKKVKSTLYIQLLSALTDPFGSFCPHIFTSVPKFSQAITGIYNQTVSHCSNLDVRVLLSGLKHKDLSQIRTQSPIDLVIFDKIHNAKDIDYFLHNKISNIKEGCGVLTIDSGTYEDVRIDTVENESMYKHTVLGGTFDRLHVAHKLLLTEAALRATEKVTVGVTEEIMQQSKILWELIEPLETRMKCVEDFLKDICPELTVNIVPITDPLGPTQHDASMNLLVVSEETIKGANKVNEVRQSKGLQLLDVLKVDLIEEPNPLQNEERKISSSTKRMRLLGTLIKPVEPKNIPAKPYIIGLTGVVASGKSGIGQHLKEIGAHVIDCDKVGHGCYQPGTKCHQEVVEAFGQGIIHEGGEINRAALGNIVFGNPEKLKLLNSIVWPNIAKEVQKIISEVTCKVVVLEAAVLLQANWDSQCHEVWVTFVPPEEALTRMTKRNLTEEQAKARLSSQPANKFYIDRANVVFCSLWEVEYTKSQVVKAWESLQTRLS